MFQFNLGWKLSLVYKGHALAALLNSYQEEHLPIIAEMLGKTTELFNRAMARRGDPNISIVGRNTDMTQLGVNYRGSSIIGEEQRALIEEPRNNPADCIAFNDFGI